MKTIQAKIIDENHLELNQPLAKKATEEADQIWDEKGYSDETMEKCLKQEK